MPRTQPTTMAPISPPILPIPPKRHIAPKTILIMALRCSLAFSETFSLTGEPLFGVFACPPILEEYEIPVPGIDTRDLDPFLELKEKPPNLFPTLTPTDFLLKLSRTPGAIFLLLRNRNPISYLPKITYKLLFKLRGKNTLQTDHRCAML